MTSTENKELLPKFTKQSLVNVKDGIKKEIHDSDDVSSVYSEFYLNKDENETDLYYNEAIKAFEDEIKL